MASGKLEYKRVVALARPHLDKLLELRVEGEAAPLRATPVHPFWVRHGNQEAEWVKAAEIQSGDLILTDQGKWSRVTAVSKLHGEQTVYNFEVADDHDYFVDKPGLLVHNAGPCAPGTTVIGHFPAYVNLAQELGANYLNIPLEEWDAMSQAEQWAVNQQFLDEAIANGDTFQLATPLEDMRPGSPFAQEVQYLMSPSNGYQPSADGTQLVPPTGGNP
jgi:hypothetical protein